MPSLDRRRSPYSIRSEAMLRQVFLHNSAKQGCLVHHVRFEYGGGWFTYHAPIKLRFLKKLKAVLRLFGQPPLNY